MDCSVESIDGAEIYPRKDGVMQACCMKVGTVEVGIYEFGTINASPNQIGIAQVGVL